MGSEGVVKVKKYRVQLTEEEQQELRVLVSKGRAAAYQADSRSQLAVEQ